MDAAEPMYGGSDAEPPIPTSPTSDGGELDDFGMAITEAFPENDWTPERLGAMKEAIRLCLEKDEAGGYDEGEEKPKGKGGLALIFGAPEKKK